MLGLRFQLTPSQVDILLIMTYCEWPISYAYQKGYNDDPIKVLPLELGDYPFFLNSANSLQRKGLIGHDGKSYYVTQEGKAIAALIYNKAKQIVNYAERQTAEKVEVENVGNGSN